VPRPEFVLSPMTKAVPHGEAFVMTLPHVHVASSPQTNQPGKPAGKQYRAVYQLVKQKWLVNRLVFWLVNALSITSLVNLTFLQV
jgi:hypothetical protein